MNQKSSLREVPQLVSWVLTGNTRPDRLTSATSWPRGRAVHCYPRTA